MIVDAMKQFKTAFYSVKKNNVFSNTQILHYALSVSDYYKNEYLARLNPNVKDKRVIEQCLPDNDEAIILQYHYIANNQNPKDSKDNLEMATDGSQYSRIHSKYHSIIRNYQKRFGYYDIFLVDAQTGHIVYSVFKEVDFATSLLTGPYKNTNFAWVFKETRDATNKEFVKLVDFEFYDPSYSDPASFIASPIFDEDKQIGVLVFQVPADKINQVMTGNYNWKKEGLGESGETYIAGADYKMRNDSRFLIEEPDRYFELIEQVGADKEVINLIKLHSTSIMFQELRTEAVEDALNGNTNTKIIDDYRGIPVLSSYVPLSIEDVTWVMLSEIDKKEAFAPLEVIRDRIIFITLIISALVAIIAFLISKNISSPIIKLANSMDGVSKGDLLKRVNIARKDEIGKLADTFNIMTDSLIEANVKEKKAMEELVHSNESLSTTNEKLQIEITERKKAEETLKENEEKFRKITSSAFAAVVMMDDKGRISFWNEAASKIFGYSKEEVVGKDLHRLIVPERYYEDYLKGMEGFKENGTGLIINKTRIWPGLRKDRTEFFAEHSFSSVKIKDKWHAISIVRDITERKGTDEQIKASLKEKEVLLNEIHHRVKNNLQIISSLLDMSSMQTQNQETIELFAESRNRVESMALIHSQLYESERFDEIDMERHIQELSGNLLNIYSKEKTITLDIKSANVYLPVTQAVPCALVLNELISNSLKHAYRDGQKGTMSIIMQQSNDGTILLKVKDNGVGIPEEIDIERTKSLGLKLARNIVNRQLNGKIKIVRNKGAEFIIEFKNSKEGS
jgi:PAS domain S-box-containing protein